ncbi:MAG: hypothetical protein K9G67_08790 [Bacteroidales bacterium]|nr:hypothetical protein [Bacteroidales bacterium]MCF8343253.1 hypothetical protein [Bacteroidales bacterium]MCF8352538.1 hypothetical protein [Bacteroidales bacterium]MCF8376437.1 hypothetical protein [Bacteroidales bacterium]MCF8400556.1 hypothetical protein [Bacteroidales bacterium]
MQSHYANGKLLLTGEYFVLEGAKSLALPLKYGQRMKIRKTEKGEHLVNWKTFVPDRLWLECEFAVPSLEILSSSDQRKSQFLSELLRAAKKLKPGFPQKAIYDVEAQIDFNIEWGWGSSSSLIANVAAWTGLDPFELHFEISGGSAYDIACANSTGPILYQLKEDQPMFHRVNFDPVFKQHIFFVYLGRKQKSSAAVKAFQDKKAGYREEINRISQLTEAITQTNSLNEFNRLVEEHEQIVSAAMQMPTIKESRFKDFQGSLKSLGAWGGDFAMATCTGDEERLKKYFFEKGLKTIFLFEDIVLQPHHG